MIAKLEESGWKDQVKMTCKDIVKERGLDKITVEDLVQESFMSISIDNQCFHFRKLLLKGVKWFQMRFGRNY